MKSKIRRLIFISLLSSVSLCACSSGGGSKVELSEHQLILQPGQSHVFNVKKNDRKNISFDVANQEIISFDEQNLTLTAKKEGRTIFSALQDGRRDDCEVVVRYDHIESVEPLNVATIAHKGYHKDAIENTLEAFSEAGRRDFFGIETDIHRTKDNRWVCNHDNKIKGMDKTISECTFEEIMEVNLSDDPNSVIKVCSFEDYVSVCNAYNKHPVIEFKESTSKEHMNEVINILSGYSVLDEVIFISKLGDVLGSLLNIKNENNYKFDLQMLTEGSGWQYVSEYLNVSSQYEAITSSMVENCNLIGQYVAAWTVNDRDIANSLIELGVKYITTDVFECDFQYIDHTLFGI